MKIRMTGTGSLTAMQESASCLIDGHILFDCGNGLVKSLMQQGIDLLDIDQVFITHIHGDHILDLPFLILIRSFAAPERPMDICGYEGIAELLRNIIALVFPDIIDDWDGIVEKANIHFVEFHNALMADLGECQIRSVRVSHGDLDHCYGYIVEDGETVLGITGDSGICEGVEEIVSCSDIAICDMSMVTGIAPHMGINDIRYLIDRYDKPLIATHLSARSREEAEKENLTGLIIGCDGMEISCLGSKITVEKPKR